MKSEAISAAPLLTVLLNSGNTILQKARRPSLENQTSRLISTEYDSMPIYYYTRALFIYLYSYNSYIALPGYNNVVKVNKTTAPLQTCQRGRLVSNTTDMKPFLYFKRSMHVPRTRDSLSHSYSTTIS